MTQHATKIADTFPIVMAFSGITQSYSLKIQDNRDELPGHSMFTLHGQISGFGQQGGNYGGQSWLKQVPNIHDDVDYDSENGEFFAHSDNLATLIQLVYALRNDIDSDCDDPIAQMGGRDLSVTPSSKRNTRLADWADGWGRVHDSTEAWAAMIKRETKGEERPVLKYRVTIEVEIPTQGDGPEKIGNISRMINKAAWDGADAYYGKVTITDESVS